MMRLGLDRIEVWKPMLEGRRVGLVTSPASLDGSYRDCVDVLGENCRLVLLMGPEHGVRGASDAGQGVASGKDPLTGIETLSLYDGSGVGLDPSVAGKVDVIVYDIQDLGLRFYTYVATLKGLLNDCSELGLPVVVLDRPNPLGDEVFGNILAREDFSFVGPDELPVRYGLTAGELALWFNSRLSRPAMLEVVSMEGYSRGMLWPDLGRLWAPTSPAIGSFESAFCYSGMCLLEGTDLSEGRGTSTPFRLFGAPYLDCVWLCDMLNGRFGDGAAFTSRLFTPASGKYAGRLCNGVFIFPTDMRKVNMIEVAVWAISLVFSRHSEFEAKAGLARLCGHDYVEGILNDPEGLLERWRADGQTFKANTEGVHLYA